MKTEEISLKELLDKVKSLIRELKSQSKIILFAAFLGGIAGIGYSVLKRPVYVAKLTFALEDDDTGFGGALGLASQFGLALGGKGGGAFSGDNLLELMKSRTMVEKALLTTIEIDGEVQTLAEHYLNFNKLRESWSWRFNPQLRNVHFEPELVKQSHSRIQDSVLGVIHKNLIENSLSVVKQDKKLSIVSITLNSKSEKFAKFFTEVLIKEVSNFYVETKTKKSAGNLAILQHQTDSVRRQLNLAIGGVAISADAYPNPNPALQRLRVPTQKRSIDVQANTAILTELVKNLEISKVSLRKETPLIQVIDKPIFPLEVHRVSKIKGFIVGLILLFFLSVFFLSIKIVYKNINGEL